MLQTNHNALIDKFYDDVKKLGLRFPGAEITRKTGQSKGDISQILNKKKTPSANFIKTFYKAFSEEFEKIHQNLIPESDSIIPVSDTVFSTYQQERLNKKLQPTKKEIPFYDAPAEGGNLEMTEMNAIHAPSGTIDVGDLLNDSEAALRVYGNSMIPNYPPGCVVGLIKYNESFIEPGEVYVIETTKFRRVKRLFYKDDDPGSELIMCYSDNSMKFENGARDGKLAYPPFFVKKEEIINLYLVSGVIKRNANSIIINR